MSSLLIYYLIIINICGFLLSMVDILLRRKGKEIYLDVALIVLAVIGGSLGSLLAILILDPKPQKQNMMVRIFTLCAFLIELLAVLLWNTLNLHAINLNFIAFFAGHKILLIYLGIINILTFALFGIDKYKAVKGASRIRIVTLLGACFIGGSLGGLVGMYAFRHKTRINYFTIGIPLIIFVQLLVLILVMNLI